MNSLSRLANSLNKILSFISPRAGDLGGIAITGMVVLIVADVTLRRFFNSPLSYSLELIQDLLLIAVFSSVFYATHIDRHVSIDLITSKLSKKAQNRIGVATDFLSAILFALLGWRSIHQGIHVWDMGLESAGLEIPYYPFHFFIAICAILVTISISVKIIAGVTNLEV